MAWVTFFTPLIFAIVLLISYDKRAITATQEGVVIGYYMLLAFSLCRGNWFLVGASVGLCIMSRYLLLPWVGILLITMWIHASRKEVGAFITGMLVLPIILVIISGVWPHLGNIAGLAEHYLEAVTSLPGKYAYTIEQSPGMARFFFPTSMDQLSKIMLGGALVIPTIGFMSYLGRKSSLPLHLYALCMLKLSMVWILSFILIPYNYIFLSSILLSIFLLFAVPRGA